MVDVKRPWLWLSAEAAHKWAPFFLRPISILGSNKLLVWQPFDWKGLHFPNRLGLAGGIDKDAMNTKDWWRLGVGFIEVGTVTPQPQEANPGVVVARDEARKALWNRLGFPSSGSFAIYQKLKALKRPYKTPLFINIGKNRTTPNEKAVDDYKFLAQKFSDVADAFVVNVSSPNTKGLRELLQKENLEPLLKQIRQATKKPVLLKLSPDTTADELKSTIDVAYDCGIDGAILTNTTLDREPGMTFSNEGGVSGLPLKNKSLLALETVCSHLGPRKSNFLVVSVGGVFDVQDIQQRLKVGADLVQAYTAIIYEGPLFFKKIAQGMA
ncbi:MAG: quinone-dependent dihydroorotate dehydrogenase [Bdellovibrionota bacterium]